MAEFIFKTLIVLGFCSTVTLVISTLFAIGKAADELERIADALEDVDKEEEGGAE